MKPNVFATAPKVLPALREQIKEGRRGGAREGRRGHRIGTFGGVVSGTVQLVWRNADQPFLTFRRSRARRLEPTGSSRRWTRGAHGRGPGAPGGRAPSQWGKQPPTFRYARPEVVHSAESLLFASNPQTSYVSKGFAAGDPEFSNPKPFWPSPPAKATPQPASAKP